MASPADVEIGIEIDAKATEHRPSKFGFTIEEGTWRVVYTTSWCLSQWGVLMLRTSLLVCWSIVLIWSMTDSIVDSSYQYYWTYLTHWSAFAEWLYFVSVTHLSFLVYNTDAKKSDDLFLAVAQTSWILGAAVPTMSFLVFALYWLLVFTPGNLQALSVFTHGVNFFFVLMDFLLTHQPYRIQHMYVAFIGGLAYAVFTIIYYASTSRIVYAALDWSKPKETSIMSIVIVFIVIPAVYSMWFGILYLRKCCLSKHATSSERE